MLVYVKVEGWIFTSYVWCWMLQQRMLELCALPCGWGSEMRHDAITPCLPCCSCGPRSHVLTRHFWVAGENVLWLHIHQGIRWGFLCYPTGWFLRGHKKIYFASVFLEIRGKYIIGLPKESPGKTTALILQLLWFVTWSSTESGGRCWSGSHRNLWSGRLLRSFGELATAAGLSPVPFSPQEARPASIASVTAVAVSPAHLLTTSMVSLQSDRPP